MATKKRAISSPIGACSITSFENILLSRRLSEAPVKCDWKPAESRLLFFFTVYACFTLRASILVLASILFIDRSERLSALI